MDDDWGRPNEEPVEAELAGRVARLVAVLINAAVFFLVPFVLALFVGAGVEQSSTRLDDGGVVHDNSITNAPGWVVFACWLVFAVASCILIAKRGQSIGKALVGIRVVRTDGTRAGFWRIVALRWLVLLVGSFVFAPLGLIDALFVVRRDRRCLHDLIADTKVVMDARMPHVTKPPASAVTNVLAPAIAPGDGPSSVPFGRPEPPPAW